jgi:hypothetical protein
MLKAHTHYIITYDILEKATWGESGNFTIWTLTLTLPSYLFALLLTLILWNAVGLKIDEEMINLWIKLWDT